MSGTGAAVAGPSPLGSPSASLGSPCGPGPDLLVTLRASARGPDIATLHCFSLGGTAVAVLEVDPARESVAGLVEALSSRLEALLTRSGEWTQKVRLAYPDGRLLAESEVSAGTVAELLDSAAWQEAERSLEGGAAVAADTPTGAGTAAAEEECEGGGGMLRRRHTRSDSRTRDLEANLRKLQEAKQLPLSSGGINSTKRHAGRQVAPEFTAGASGTRVVLTSSHDEAHPGDNVIDGRESTYWISTGLYPQEILLELGRPSRVSGVRLATTSVRSVRIEGCSEAAAVHFETLAAGDMIDAGPRRLQKKELRCEVQSAPTRFVKTMILSGWHDFCSVHRIVVVE